MSTNRSPFGPRASEDWFRIEPRAAAETEPASADVYIYEQIGYDWWTGKGVTAKSFAEQLGTLDVDTIRLHLNSPGGLAYDGLTIMNALRDHRARVEVTVDGLAASAASVIMMAGDKRTMNRGAQLMIHDASTIAWGNPAAIEKAAAQLHKLSDSYADSYAARAGGTREEWRAAMQAETWYTAEEAVAAGLADDWVDAPDEDAIAAVARFDLNAFAYAGRAQAPAPRIEPHKPPVSAEPGTTRETEKLTMSDTFLASVRARLGMTDAEASEETVLAALDEVLEEQADTDTAAAVVAPTAALPAGFVAIDETVLAEMQSNARQGADARAEQERTRRDGIVATALQEGRITAASRDAIRAQLDTDEAGTVAFLATVAKNTVPVEEIGHQAAASADADAYPAHWKR